MRDRIDHLKREIELREKGGGTPFKAMVIEGMKDELREFESAFAYLKSKGFSDDGPQQTAQKS